jgi:hypothetical protein
MNKVWIAIVLSSVASLGHATQQAFLIQNSGWMEPFYQDQNSEFKPLINGVIQTVSKPDDKIVVSVFNQSNALAKSPKIIYQGAGAKPMLADLQAQQIAYKMIKPMPIPILLKQWFPQLPSLLPSNRGLSGFLPIIKTARIMMLKLLHAIKSFIR